MYLIPEAMVQKLSLLSSVIKRKKKAEFTNYTSPSAALLGWIHKDVESTITELCNFKLVITTEFTDKVTCDMVSLVVCQVILAVLICGIAIQSSIASFRIIDCQRIVLSILSVLLRFLFRLCLLLLKSSGWLTLTLVVSLSY